MSEITIIQGDALANLRAMSPASVHCIVTSPPYYGLRDYGTGTWIGGDPSCNHKTRGPAGAASSTLAGGKATTNHQQEGYRQTCAKCGAGRQDDQIGLEPTVDEYVGRLVEVFEKCRRVLRDDGTLWLNLGDSYVTTPPGNKGFHYGPGRTAQGLLETGHSSRGKGTVSGVKPKNLIGIPWRVAFALQAAGWWLRADIIWAKRAPMPESVTDRPTRSHEHVFLLSKSERYYYDQVAVREPSAGQNGSAANFARETKDHQIPGQSAIQHRTDRTPTSDSGYRNQRDVWTLGPEPYPEAHFATFPSEIPSRAILAGTSARGCCPACGAPWVRVASRRFVPQPDIRDPDKLSKASRKGLDTSNGWGDTPRGSTAVDTVCWRPACDCPPADPIPCTVLDPFMGSGTTLAVARGLGRNGVGIELNPDYIELARRRIQRTYEPLPGMLA